MKKDLNVKIELDFNSLKYNFDNKLITSSNSVLLGNELINSYKNSKQFNNEPRFSNLPFYIEEYSKSIEIFNNWIILKGFEDIVSALNELLVSINYIIEFNKRIKDIKIGELIKDFHQLAWQDYDKISKPHFPELIKRVENYLGKLECKKELFSINKARNCLVHRKGIVDINDFNMNNALIVQWWQFEYSKIKDIQRKEIIYFKKENRKSKEKIFNKGESINFTLQEYIEFVIFAQSVSYEILNKFIK